MATVSPCLYRPIQGIKELVDTGMTHVPERYVRSLENRPCMSQVVIPDQLPVIDFGGFFGSRRKKILEELAMACEDWGFFQIVNHGVPGDVITRLWESAAMFFRQPAQERMRLYSEDLKKPVAYMTSFDVQNEKFSDWKDSLIFRCFPGDLDTFQEAPDYCRAAVVEYLKEVRSLGTKIYGALSESLGLSTEYVECTTASQKRLTMPMHYYPPCPDPSLTLGFSEHSDPNNFTILLQDDVGGLQVLKNGKWVAVLPQPHAFIVNLGDQIQIMTNGRYKSVQHRVVTNRNKPRMSIPCFFCPNLEAKIGPLPEILEQDKKTAIYKEIMFREYLQHFNKIGLVGKACLDYAKI